MSMKLMAWAYWGSQFRLKLEVNSCRKESAYGSAAELDK
jgi:hypothetical protein